MKIEYRKIFNKNYAIITDYNIKDYKECYRSKMLKSNQLNNLLPYDIQNLNGVIQFTYDISSKQSINSFYENSDIDYEMVRHLIMSLKTAFDTLNNFLLEPDYIVLDPQLIYMNIATKSIYFCYCPGENNNFYDSLNNFLCYILSKINHEDNNSIILAYSLQQQSTNKNYTFDDLMEILNKPVFQHTEKNPPTNTEQESTFNAEYEVSPNHNIDHTSIPDNKDSTLSPALDQTACCKNNIPLLFTVLFFILSGAIFYYGILQAHFSLELTLLLCAVCAFICFNLSSFIKGSQKKLSDIYHEADDISPCCSPEYNIPQQTLSEDDITTESSYCEDTVILGYRNTENAPKLIYTGTDFESVNEITSFPYTIGKMEQNVNMIISHPMISRIHAKIYLKENHYYIEDMNSSNGTYINNSLIQPHTLTEISPGDYITFSHLTYIFQ